MYSDKPHINSLTKALLHLGITDIVVCPGARNAPLCHNFHQAGFTLHPVTDERSATFVAIGIYLETHRPTVVCVTSGTALSLLPAELYHLDGRGKMTLLLLLLFLFFFLEGGTPTNGKYQALLSESLQLRQHCSEVSLLMVRFTFKLS